MKTSINMGTLQLAIWLCLLDCSPPYRSAHTECTVPNQLFIHFSLQWQDQPRSLLQGCWGLMACISGLKSFFSPKPNIEHHRILTLSLFCPFLWPPFLCVFWEDGQCSSVLSSTGLKPGWSPTFSPTCDPGQVGYLCSPCFLINKIWMIVEPITIIIGLFLVVNE